MDITGFLSSYPGMYVVQSFLHSLVAAALVDSAITAWNIKDPVSRQRLRFIVVLGPVVFFPLFQFLNPERGYVEFRLGALFDASRWLSLELWGKVPTDVVFLSVLGLTAAVSIFQELVPILRHTMESKNTGIEFESPGEGHVVNRALEGLPVNRPDIFILDDEEPLVFSATGRKAAVYLSTGLVDALDEEQVQAAVSHEIAHINRSRRPVLVLVFVFRMLMFFNPAVLLEFRRIVQEEEKICDDMAVALTGKPLALAGGLRKFLHSHEAPQGEAGPSTLGDTLDMYGHDFLLEMRIRRLEEGEWREGGGGGGWLQFALTLGLIMLLNYFVV